MIDRIELRGLRLMTIIGVLDHERLAPQPLEIDITLHADLTGACENDELSETVHYGEVCEVVEKIAAEFHDLLLERLAGRLAQAILAFARVETVDVTIRKLRPPIPSDVATSAVSIRRSRVTSLPLGAGTVRAIVALGSNLGDRVAHLRHAVANVGVVVAQSQVYETPPVGPEGQGPYLNMVLAVDTPLDPYAFLRRCHRVEADAGRVRGVRWGARTLDVDLLFHGDARVDSAELTVPHPRINERRFVLQPLSEVAPELAPADWQTTLPAEDIRPLGPLHDL